MNRRNLLKNTSLLSIVGLSGCLDFIQNKNDYNSNEEITVTVSEVASNPDTTGYDLNFNINVDTDIASDDGPPRIIVSVENKDDMDVILTGTTRAVFGGEKDTENNIALLKPTEWTDKQVKSDKCWSLENEIPRVGTKYETHLDSDEYKEIKFDVIGTSESNGCIPEGNYKFETDYSLLLPDESGNEKVSSFRWGFILSIDRKEN